MERPEINYRIKEQFAVVQEGKLAEKNDSELHSMLSILRQYQAFVFDPDTKPTIYAIENELSRRLSKQMMEQNKALHQEAMKGHGELKDSVQELKKPHWTMTPNFWIALMAMIFAAIASWPVIRGWFQSASPDSKAANFQPPQSHSTPAIQLTNQTSTVATGVIQRTNAAPK